MSDERLIGRIRELRTHRNAVENALGDLVNEYKRRQDAAKEDRELQECK